MIEITPVDGNTWVLKGILTRESLPTKFPKEIFTQSAEHQGCIVDLSKVESVDSAGLAWLLLLAEKQLNRGQSMSLKQPSTQFMQLAKLTGVDSLLTFTD